jgi:hypothetical protein
MSNTNINSGVYSTLGDTITYTDLGIMFDDTINNRTIKGIKTFTQLPATQQTTFSLPQQLVSKNYIDNIVPKIYTSTNISGVSIDINSNNIVYYNNTTSTFSKNIITLQRAATLTSNNLVIAVDNPSNGDQLFSLGPGSVGMWVAVGLGTHTIAYSYDGINWVGLGMNIFSVIGIGVAWNGTMWVAVGGGVVNTMGYSYDGIYWIGLGITVLNSGGSTGGIIWNGIMWLVGISVAPNFLAYSYDGINWTGLGSTNSVTSVGAQVFCLGWNGSMWLCGNSGQGMHYSYNGINWFVSKGFNSGVIVKAIGWNGINWLVSAANGTLWMSYDGLNWMSVQGLAVLYGLVWNGNMWLGVANANPSVYISNNGFNWTTAIGLSFSATANVLPIFWNGIMYLCGFSAAGMMYSYNGYNWFLVNFCPFTGATNCFGWSGRKQNNIYLPQSRMLALGTGTAGTIAYKFAGTTNNNSAYDLSNNWTWGITSLGASTTTLFSQANSAAWNGFQWIAVGLPVPGSVIGNTLAFSNIINGNVYSIPINNTNGMNLCNNAIGNAGNVWTGLGNYIFSTGGYGIGWNGNVWVACGQGGNTLAYSPNGFSWFGLGTTIFNNFGLSVVWNGTYWLATGSGTGNTMAYSVDGVTWTGLNNIIFSGQGNGSIWNGTYWVAVGNGVGNTIAVSWDTKNWFGLGVSVFSTSGKGIAVNSSNGMYVIAGEGINTIAYSTDGISWTGTRINIFGFRGTSVIWNGKYWVASGEGGLNTLAYSADGINWTADGASLFLYNVKGLAANMAKGSVILQTNYTAPPTVSNPIWVVSGVINYNSPLNTNISMAYSANGQTWTGITNPVFTAQGNCVAYSSNNTWIATGAGGNTLAFSTTGNIWTGLGINIFSVTGNFATWNGVMWVAVGIGANTIAYSYNGITWTGAGSGIFSNSGNDITWNGWMWVAGGAGGNTLAYSYDGINWFGLGTTVFTAAGFSINWNGFVWVTAGQGTNTLAYSYNGQYWIGLGSSIFTTGCYDVVWNGKIWIAVGEGTNAIAWSQTGIANWNGLGVTTISTGYLTIGYSVIWGGTTWMACGTGAQGVTVYSPNGKLWFSNQNTLLTIAYSVAYSNYFSNKLFLDKTAYNSTQVLEFTADTCYQNGYNQLIVTANI